MASPSDSIKPEIKNYNNLTFGGLIRLMTELEDLYGYSKFDIGAHREARIIIIFLN